MIEASDENVVLTECQVIMGDGPEASMARLARRRRGTRLLKLPRLFFPRGYESIVSHEKGKDY